MSEKFQQHLFTPFEQEDGTVSRKYGGTGLGMAITKNLVSLLGGVIYVKSKQGEGTSFTVELPVRVPEEDEGQESGVLDDLKVLVVDDDESSCTCLLYTSVSEHTAGQRKTRPANWNYETVKLPGGLRQKESYC